MANSGHFRTWVLDPHDLSSLGIEMRRIAVDRGGIPLMAPKGVICAIVMEDVPTKAANIIKQEILARGGDLATPWSCADFAVQAVDAIFLGNLVTMRSLVAKLFRQTVYQLPEIAEALQSVLMHTMPGYLPVARAPARQGFVVEETLDDLFGGRIPTQRGRATAQPTLVAPGRHADSPWTFGDHTRLVGVVTVPDGAPDESVHRCLAAATRLTDQGATLVELRPASVRAAGLLPQAAAAINVLLPDLLLALPATLPSGSPEALASADLIICRGGVAGSLRLPDAGVDFKGPVLLMLSTPDTPGAAGDVVTAAHRAVWSILEQATASGLNLDQVMLGFAPGRSQTQIWRRLREFRSYGRPLWLDLPDDGEAAPTDTPAPTVAAAVAAAATHATLAVCGGADFLCALHIDPVQAAVRMADAILRTAAYT